MRLLFRFSWFHKTGLSGSSSDHSGDGIAKIESSLVEVSEVELSLTVNEVGHECLEFIDLPDDVVEPVPACLSRVHSSKEYVVEVSCELLDSAVRLGNLVCVCLGDGLSEPSNVLVAVPNLVVHLITWHSQEHTPREATEVCPEVYLLCLLQVHVRGR